MHCLRCRSVVGFYSDIIIFFLLISLISNRCQPYRYNVFTPEVQTALKKFAMYFPH